MGLPLQASLLLACLAAAGCSPRHELDLYNRLSETVGLEVRAPRPQLRGGCDAPLETRFCREEFESLGLVDIAAGDRRVLALSDEVGEGRCTQVLWLRLLHLGDVGPVDDPGTQLALPAVAEIERGAGAVHVVAFPQATVRIDEAGPLDENQAPAPRSCGELGRAPR